jgi:hypothetical protein
MVNPLINAEVINCIFSFVRQKMYIYLFIIKSRCQQKYLPFYCILSQKNVQWRSLKNSKKMTAVVVQFRPRFCTCQETCQKYLPDPDTIALCDSLIPCLLTKTYFL